MEDTLRLVQRGEARVEATARLRAAGDETAGLDADLLLAHLLGTTKEQLYAHLDVGMTGAAIGEYRALVERRAAGEPLAYLRGWKEFYGLRFVVDPRVLIPRPETEALVEAALDHMRRARRYAVADVGVGCGAIAIAIAANEPIASVIAIDSSRDALEIAQANLRAHGLEGRVELRMGDLLEPLDAPVDLVAANLPYLRPQALKDLTGERTSLIYEPRSAVLAGPDGLEVIRRCIAQLPGKLAPGGAALFECDPPQAGDVEELLRRTIDATTRVISDLSGSPRVVEGISPLL